MLHGLKAVHREHNVVAMIVPYNASVRWLTTSLPTFGESRHEIVPTRQWIGPGDRRSCGTRRYLSRRPSHDLVEIYRISSGEKH